MDGHKDGLFLLQFVKLSGFLNAFILRWLIFFFIFIICCVIPLCHKEKQRMGSFEVSPAQHYN